MRLRLACAIISFHLMALTALAQMGTQKDALRGMTGFSVVVKSLDKAVMTDTQLQVQVELRLRRAGILVNACKTDTVCLPQIFVKLNAVQQGDKLKYCFLTIECNTFVAPIGQPTRRLIATVWLNEDSMLALLNEYGPVRDQIDHLIDEFANDYLAANPKPQP